MMIFFFVKILYEKIILLLIILREIDARTLYNVVLQDFQFFVKLISRNFHKKAILVICCLLKELFYSILTENNVFASEIHFTIFSSKLWFF